jgi:hypothetical protein
LVQPRVGVARRRVWDESSRQKPLKSQVAGGQGHAASPSPASPRAKGKSRSSKKFVSYLI